MKIFRQHSLIGKLDQKRFVKIIADESSLVNCGSLVGNDV